MVGDHGEVTGTPMAAVAGMVTATLPKLEWLGYVVEDVEANTAELR